MCDIVKRLDPPLPCRGTGYKVFECSPTGRLKGPHTLIGWRLGETKTWSPRWASRDHREYSNGFFLFSSRLDARRYDYPDTCSVIVEVRYCGLGGIGESPTRGGFRIPSFTARQVTPLRIVWRGRTAGLWLRRAKQRAKRRAK